MVKTVTNNMIYSVEIEQLKAKTEEITWFYCT